MSGKAPHSVNQITLQHALSDHNDLKWGDRRNGESPMRDPRKSSNLASVVWAVIALIGLAIVSVALGVATVDSAIFAAPLTPPLHGYRGPRYAKRTLARPCKPPGNGMRTSERDEHRISE